MRNVNFLKSMEDTRLFFGYKRIIRCVLIPSLSKESFHSKCGFIGKPDTGYVLF